VEFYHSFSIESIQTLTDRFERSKLNHSCSLSNFNWIYCRIIECFL